MLCKLKNDFGSFKLYKLNKTYILGSTLNTLNILKTKNDENKLNAFKIFISKLNENIVTVDNIKFFNNPYCSVLFEYFVGIPYFFENMDKRTVIDVGGNIGDTALYYANKGALVYAFEPITPLYDIALKNINLNTNLKENIHFYNKAVSKKMEKWKYFLKGYLHLL